MTISSNTERTLATVLSELNELQLKFVMYRINTNTDTAAAKLAGIHSKTPIKWRKIGVPIDEAIRIMQLTAVQSSLEALKAATLLAVKTLVDEMLNNGDEKIRAALAVLDRGGIPATSNVQANVTGGGLLVVLDEPTED